MTSTIGHFINGAHHPGIGTATGPVFNPATGEETARVAMGAEAEVQAAVGAVVLHGRPGTFSAGFDLGVMTGTDLGAIIDLVADGGDLVRRLYGSSVPVVAACTGHALAAGALVLLGCDVRIGADVDAKIGLNEVAIKMVLPDWAFTIAGERLSRRHLPRAVANARLTSPADAVDRSARCRSAT